MTGHSLFVCIDALYQREVEASFSVQFVDPGTLKNPSEASSLQLGAFWSTTSSSPKDTTSQQTWSHLSEPLETPIPLNSRIPSDSQQVNNSSTSSFSNQETEQQQQQPVQVKLHGYIGQVLRLIRSITVPNSNTEMIGTVTFSLKLNDEEQKYFCESDEKNYFRWIASRSGASVRLECGAASGDSSHIIIMSGKFDCVIKAYDLVAELLDPQNRGKHPFETKPPLNEPKHLSSSESGSEFPAVWLTLQESSLGDPFSSRQHSPVSRPFSDWVVPPSLVTSVNSHPPIHSSSHSTNNNNNNNNNSHHHHNNDHSHHNHSNYSLPSSSFSYKKEDNIIVRSLPISADLGGVVVGRGGTMINRVRRDFGVEVDINPGETCVRLKGPKSAVDAAFRFYERKLEHALRKRGEFHLSSPTHFSSEEAEVTEGKSVSSSPLVFSSHSTSLSPHSVPSLMPVNDSQFDDGFAGDRNLFGELLPDIRHRHW